MLNSFLFVVFVVFVAFLGWQILPKPESEKTVQTPTVTATPTATPTTTPVPTFEPEQVRDCLDSKQFIEQNQNLKMSDQLPIPEGVTVAVTRTCSGDYALKYVVERSGGQVVTFHQFLVDGGELAPVYFDPYHEPAVKPVSDKDVGKISYSWSEDGELVGIFVLEIPVWGPPEMNVLSHLADVSAEAQALGQGWVILDYAADCYPGEFRVDGEKAVLGPYGYTFNVPDGLSNFTAIDLAGDCGSEKETTRWELQVKPGDIILGTETARVIPIIDWDPRAFCTFQKYQRPQWQPRVSLWTWGYCPSLELWDYSSVDTIFKKMGLIPYFSDLSENQVSLLYRYWGEIPTPEGSAWVTLSEMEGVRTTKTIYVDSNMEELELEVGMPVDSDTNWSFRVKKDSKITSSFDAYLPNGVQVLVTVGEIGWTEKFEWDNPQFFWLRAVRSGEGKFEVRLEMLTFPEE